MMETLGENKRLDIVIFGATGFTGKYAALEAYNICKANGLTWGIAGRSQSKLSKVLEEINTKTGDETVLKIPTIIAQIKDEASLAAMTARAKVLVNCCGPYRFYGEPVIKACIETKTHQVDVSGEPQYMETMQLEYGKAAADAGVYIISACGFDSIPNDMGVVFLTQHFKGTLNSIESYLTTHVPREYHTFGEAGLHYGTWESLIHGLAHYDELPAIRRKLYPTPLPPFKPKLSARKVLHKNLDLWCLPFPGADNSIVYRTQRYFHDNEDRRPVQFKAYIAFPRLYQALGVALAAIFLFIMSMCSITRKFLLNHPRLCSLGMASHEGPSEGTMKNTKFMMTMIGTGWDESVKDIDQTPPNKTVVAKVKGVNPGYGATVTALIYSALTILKESDKIPGSGGVLTTGAAFAKTNLINNLNENNLTFEIIDKDGKES